MTREVVALTPQLLELRDLLAFQTSETGRAMIVKLPAIQVCRRHHP